MSWYEQLQHFGSFVSGAICGGLLYVFVVKPGLESFLTRRYLKRVNRWYEERERRERTTK